jgi:predicted transglutaminase-like cysteine proteinase
MRLALCTVETGESHAVLLVADPESGGDWILDNRQPAPYTLDEFRGLGYRGDALQVPGRQTWETWKT